MYKRSCSVVIVAILQCLVFSQAYADTRLIMPGLNAQWVAKNMTQNGIPMNIRALEGPIGVDAVVDYYRQLWQSVKTIRQGEWRTLSGVMNNSLYTIRLRSAGIGCEGYLMVSATPDQAIKESTRIPLPHGVRVISRQAYDDGGNTGESLTLASYQQPATLGINFHHSLSAAGWTVLNAHPARTTSQGYVASYHHQTGVIKLFIHRDSKAYSGQSLILLHRLGASG